MAEKQTRISEEKARKIAVGATVAGVLLVLFLLVIIVVQIVQISVRSKTMDRIDEQTKQFEDLIEKESSDLEYYESELGMYHQALEQGWSAR